MAKKRTLPENIRKYKQEYLRLGVQEARLTQQLYRMKKRIKSLAQEEELRLSEKALLSKLLQQVHQQKTDLESQPASKQRDTQLKRVEKEYKQVKAKHSRNQYQLDKLEVKKDKDNVVKLLVKEARLDQVRIRLKAAYETWMHLEQMQQYEITLLQSLMDAHRNTPVPTDTTSKLGRVQALSCPITFLEIEKIFLSKAFYKESEAHFTRGRLGRCAGLFAQRGWRRPRAGKH